VDLWNVCIVVYSDKHVKSVNAQYEQNKELLTFKAGGVYIITGFKPLIKIKT
jgi:hypothetical protein